jgi:signal transduction histidine kinase
VTDDPGSRPTLARELLWNIGLLTVAALTLAVGTTLFVQSLAPAPALAALLVLISADLAILFVFGRHLVRRLVLTPVRTLMAAAEVIAQGNLDVRVPPAETAELNRLAGRITDMAEALRDAQGQLVRAEKLAGIGRLAAGIAHEVGNPLAAIANYVEVLRRRGAEPALIADVSREVTRIDTIVRGLLAYARPHPDEGEIGSVDVADVAGRVVELLANQGVTRGRAVALELQPGLPAVSGRAHAFEQVLVNLLLNALDAAPTGAVGVTAVAQAYAPGSSSGVRRDDRGAGVPPRRPARTPRRPDLQPGTPGVLLVVTDTGPGVAEADRERVFDPFHTTKPPGAGTGLGLAIAQRIVHEMGGLVWVEDAREGGAAFKVFVPAGTTGTAGATEASPSAGPPARRSAQAGEGAGA